ncbi:MAG: hypothetical protein ABIZ04_15005 [Opitutus sp.]
MNTTVRPEIRLQLRELSQLFNSMDPSPFHDRDLDADAEEFILSWARELPPKAELELTIHLASVPTPAGVAGVESAVQHYFGTRAEMKHREFRQLMRRGRTSLTIGLLFLAACLGVSELFAKIGQSSSSILLKESLTIGGWVAMWRPLEIYLYDWWPVQVERRMLERLARMRVTLNTSTAPLNFTARAASTSN